MSEDYAACRVGRDQSPINIDTDLVEPSESGPLKIQYQGKTTSILNNGHTLQVNVEPGNVSIVDGVAYELLQFHFHTPAEHEIDGELFPLEMHFVHKNADGEYAVFGVLFREGEVNEKIKAISDSASTEPNSSVPYESSLIEFVGMEEISKYYYYDGSLTTPPCSEGLRWFVYPDVATVSRQQIGEYVELIGYDARGVQPINGRIVKSTK